MKDFATELLRSYGSKAVLVVLIAFVVLWFVAHSLANPGGKVSLFWGLVDYQKAGPAKEGEAPGSEPQPEREVRLSASELTALRDLNDEQLRLFLIVGGSTGDEVVYQDKTPPYRAKRNYQLLDELGLIAYGEQDDQGRHRFRTTDLGRRLHRAAIEELRGGTRDTE